MTFGDQMSIFGEPSAAAKAAADEAIQRAEDHAPEGWNQRADAAILKICRARETFTADAVWERLGQPPEPKALGAAMRRAARAGWCEPTSQVTPSQRKVNHGRPVRVWRSKVYGA